MTTWLELRVVSALVASPPRTTDELAAIVAADSGDLAVTPLAVDGCARRVADLGVIVDVAGRWSLV